MAGLIKVDDNIEKKTEFSEKKNNNNTDSSRRLWTI